MGSMKVDLNIVNQNSMPNGFGVKNNRRKPNFTGATSAATEILSDTARANLVTKKITQGLPQAGVLNMMKKLEWLKGEIGGIIITAIGTGTVAPIFIAFNPFAKAPKNATPEEKKKNTETKEYTAMRQPISAALAILFQASVQKYIDKGLDAFLNNPKYAKYARFDEDHTILNTDTYIKDMVRKEFKKDNIKKPSMLYYFRGPKEEYNGEMVRKRTKYDSMFNDRVDAIRDKQIDDLAELMSKNAASDAEGLIPLASGKYWDNNVVAEILNKQIDSYRKDARNMMKKPEEINGKVKRAKILIDNEAHLRDIFKDIKIEETRKAPYGSDEIKKLYKETENTIDDLLAKEKNPDVKTILQEIKDRPDDLRAHRVERTLERIDDIKKMCGGKFNQDKYMDAILERNSILSKIDTRLEALKIKDIKNTTKDEISEAVKKVADECRFKEDGSIRESILKGTDTFGTDVKGLIKKVYKDMAKGCKKVMKNSHTSWSQFIKIAVGVFITLPITCTALNWVYPRFMEIFFPKLAGVKKTPQDQKVGGDK